MTSRYRFSVDTENQDGRTIFSNTLEFDAEQLSDVIGNFELFLKGSGFELGGHVDIIENEYTTHNTYNNLPNSSDVVDDWDLNAYQGGDLNQEHTETADITIKRPDNTEGGTLD